MKKHRPPALPLSGASESLRQQIVHAMAGVVRDADNPEAAYRLLDQLARGDKSVALKTLGDLKAAREAARDRLAASRVLLRYRALPRTAGVHADDRHRILAVLLGNRGSKTTTGAAEWSMLLLGCHPYKTLGVADPVPPGERRVRIPFPCTLLAVCTDHNKLTHVVLEKLLHNHEMTAHADVSGGFLPVGSWRHQKREACVTLDNGSKLLYMSERAEPTAFESLKLHGAWIDEEIDEDRWNRIWMRLADAEGVMLNTVTRLTPVTKWMHEKFFGESSELRPLVAKFTGSIWDNPHLTDEAKRQALAAYTDPAERHARETGEGVVGSAKCFFGQSLVTNLTLRQKSLPAPFFAGALDGETGALIDALDDDFVLYDDPATVTDEVAVGVDVGGGVVGNDRTVITVVDPATRRMLARWRGWCSARDLVDKYLPWVLRYFAGGGVVNCEYQGFGTTVNLDLMTRGLPDPFRAYTQWRTAQDGAGKVLGWGYNMGEVSRQVLIERMRATVRDPEVSIPCRHLIEQMGDFEQAYPGARPDHAHGAHDDDVFAYAHALMACEQCELAAPEVPGRGPGPHVGDSMQGPPRAPAIFGAATQPDAGPRVVRL